MPSSGETSVSARYGSKKKPGVNRTINISHMIIANLSVRSGIRWILIQIFGQKNLAGNLSTCTALTQLTLFCVNPHFGTFK